MHVDPSLLSLEALDQAVDRCVKVKTGIAGQYVYRSMYVAQLFNCFKVSADNIVTSMLVYCMYMLVSHCWYAFIRGVYMCMFIVCAERASASHLI